VDRFVRSLFLAAGFSQDPETEEKDPVALLALGGYGRRELCLGSDVDLMVIHQGKLPSAMNEVIPRAIYPLWDTRLEVGHSILTVQECIRLAMADFRVLTSVMDARFLLGSRNFYGLFHEAFWSRIERDRDSLLDEFVIRQKKRQEKYDSEDYFVEPDLKVGPGGLRDMHFMAWMSRLYFHCDRLDEIKRFAAFSHFPLDPLNHSRGFLLKVRHHLHLVAGRKEDRLFLSHHQALAAKMGYRDRGPFPASARFMRDIYLHLNRIRYSSEEFLTKSLDIISPYTPKKDAVQQVPPEFNVVKGQITLQDMSLLRKDPSWILVALEHANRWGLGLGSGLIWEARKQVITQGRQLRGSSGAKELFLGLILRPAGPKIVRLILEMGLLELFIPEFKRIRNLPETGYYHVRTVDLHSLMTLDVLKRMAEGAYDDRWPILRQVFEGLLHPEWLSLAGLLHDIGKGYGGDHCKKGSELIPRIIRRLEFSGEVLRVVPLLVKHHLLLVNISQRRDLAEERTSVQVAQVISDPDLLGMLLLLTIADSLATGPIARSDWKITLVIELFLKVQRILERGTLATPDATKKINAQKSALQETLTPEFSVHDVGPMVDQASPRYFLHTSLEDMVEHFRLALTMGDKRFQWLLQKRKDAPVTRVIQCLQDRPGLFSKMVGIFTINDIRVLSANIFTLKNGLAFDTYEVTNPLDPLREEERWQKIFREITLALEDKLPLEELISEKSMPLPDLNPPAESRLRTVKIDNQVSDFFTAVEFVSSPAERLLYDVAKAVYSLGLDIRFARVNSDHERTRGVLYVRDTDGQKIQEQDELELVRKKIFSVVQ
jgi:[protein-PII] uridylyltransferase